MSIRRHGLSIGMERVDDMFFISFKIVGKLTHQDYEKIIPMMENMLDGVKDPKVKVFCDASKLEGWELQAAWDDLKLGLKYGNKFEKIAIKGDQKWLEYMSKIASWFTPSEVEYFDKTKDAIKWLKK